MAKSTKPKPDPGAPGSLRKRVSQRGEDALGRIAEDLLDSRVVGGTVQAVLDARERASQIQEAALGALNLPSGSDLQRLTRRLRSVSQRLEGVEDGIDRLEDRLGELAGSAGAAAPASGEPVRQVLDAVESRLARLEDRLDALAGDVVALKDGLRSSPEPVPRAQERLSVPEPSG